VFVTTKVVSSNPAHGEGYSIQHYVIKFVSVLWYRSMVFSRYSGFLHQRNWPPRYNWNIVESSVKHHNHSPFLTNLILSPIYIHNVHVHDITYTFDTLLELCHLEISPRRCDNCISFGDIYHICCLRSISFSLVWKSIQLIGYRN
jgi:hypothetical protein